MPVKKNLWHEKAVSSKFLQEKRQGQKGPAVHP
jgi:hypothetical protein